MISQVENSIISATVRTDTHFDEISIHDIADFVHRALDFSVNFIGYANLGSYQIILDNCAFVETGLSANFPVSEPIFNSENNGFPKLNELSYLLAYAPKFLNTPVTLALHGLSQAVQFPLCTSVYCRISLESIRHHFDDNQSSMTGKNIQIAGEKNMCETLNISRDSMIAIERRAAPLRHGIPQHDMAWDIRQKTMEFCWEVLRRFMHHIALGSDPTWPLLE